MICADVLCRRAFDPIRPGNIYCSLECQRSVSNRLFYEKHKKALNKKHREYYRKNKAKKRAYYKAWRQRTEAWQKTMTPTSSPTSSLVAC